MKGLLLLLIAVPMLLAGGLVHGLWTNRWRESLELTTAVAQLEKLPNNFGDWKGQALEMNAELQAGAGISGYYLRRFENPQTQSSLQVLLACGLPGPLCVHTPDVCFPGSGFNQAKAPVLFRLDPGQAKGGEFWSARYAKPHELQGLQVFWSWNAGQGWQAPSNPRLSFGGTPRLFKLYIVHGSSGIETAQKNSSVEFLKVFLPEVEKTLFSLTPVPSP